MNWINCSACGGYEIINPRKITYTVKVHLLDLIPVIFENVSEKDFQEFSAQFDKKHGSTEYIVLKAGDREFRYLAHRIVGYTAEQEC